MAAAPPSFSPSLYQTLPPGLLVSPSLTHSLTRVQQKSRTCSGEETRVFHLSSPCGDMTLFFTFLSPGGVERGGREGKEEAEGELGGTGGVGARLAAHLP